MIEKSVSFLYTSNGQYDIKMKSCTPNNVKFLDITMTTYVQALYTENYRTWLKGIEVAPNKWRDAPCSWTERQYCIYKVIKLNMCIYHMTQSFYSWWREK